MPGRCHSCCGQSRIAVGVLYDSRHYGRAAKCREDRIGQEMRTAILLSLVTASIAFTVSETAAFAGIRERLRVRDAWLGKLVSCGYCSGHWIAFGLVAVYRPRLFTALWLLDYALTTLVIAWLAAFQWMALCWAMQRTGK